MTSQYYEESTAIAPQTLEAGQLWERQVPERTLCASSILSDIVYGVLYFFIYFIDLIPKRTPCASSVLSDFLYGVLYFSIYFIDLIPKFGDY